MSRRALAVVVTLATACIALTACGPKSGFKLSADDNNRYALDQTLARRKLPDQPSPLNGARQPRVFLVEAGAPRTIVAFDLATSRPMWKTSAD
ncbi:MAG: hypothetical protein NT062_00360, partial [Proteobacteria bacterium]|nr:hypothetical protein [Pseudomonadota bacterium]